MSSTDSLAYNAIRNTIARYCIALDTKDFQSLRLVFTENVTADYPPLSGEVSGLRLLMEKLEKRLSPVTTHHALSTQTIEIAADGKSATAVTYYTGVHFGQGRWTHDQVTAFGRYHDTLVLTNADGAADAPGEWRIKRRDLAFMGRLGNPDVMKGEQE